VIYERSPRSPLLIEGGVAAQPLPRLLLSSLHFVGISAFGALALLVGRQEEQPACKN